jgi:hypothetical protein
MMKRLMMLFGMLVLLFIPILAQGEVPVIPDMDYLVSNFGALMLTFAGIAAIASFIGEFFIRLIKSTKNLVKIIIVFILAIGLSFLAKVLSMGDYAIMVWWQVGLWGLLSGATASGLRGTNLLFFKSVVEFVIGLILQKEPKV